MQHIGKGKCCAKNGLEWISCWLSLLSLVWLIFIGASIKIARNSFEFDIYACAVRVLYWNWWYGLLLILLFSIDTDKMVNAPWMKFSVVHWMAHKITLQISHKMSQKTITFILHSFLFYLNVYFCILSAIFQLSLLLPFLSLITAGAAPLTDPSLPLSLFLFPLYLLPSFSFILFLSHSICLSRFIWSLPPSPSNVILYISISVRSLLSSYLVHNDKKTCLAQHIQSP